MFPNPGDYLIHRGAQVIDVCDEATLKRSYMVVEEGLFVPKETCDLIECITGVGTARTPKELLAAIDRLAFIEIGGIRIQFTPGQLEEIKHRAEKRGYTVAQELGRIVDRIKDEIFFRS